MIPPTDPFSRIVQALGDRVVRPTSRGVRAKCPGHDDHDPSLDVDRGDDGRVLLNCRSQGCTPESIVAALDLKMADLFVSANVLLPHAQPMAKKEPTRYPTPQALAEAAARFKEGTLDGTFLYRDRNGKPVFGVVRVRQSNGEKAIPQFRPDAEAWVFGGPKGPRPLFRLPELLAAAPDAPVQFFEGEQKAELAASLGFTATSCSQGAGKARHHDFATLLGRIVVVFPDNDEIGRDHAADIARRAHAAGARSVSVARLPNLPDKGDIVDFVTRRRDEGATDEEITREIDAAMAISAAISAAIPAPTPPAATESPVHEPEPVVDPGDGTRLFPIEALPPVLRCLVCEGAEAQDVDAAFLGAPMLAVLAGAIGSARGVEVREGWREPSILWVGNVAPSGTGKSPALDVLLAPVREVDEELGRKSKAAEQRYKADLAQWQREQRRNSADTGPAPEPPPTLCVLLDDATMEVVAVRLLANPRGVTFALDELSTWFAGFDAYRGGRGGDEAKWLKIYGARPLKVDRKGGGTIYVDSPHVSVVGGITPRAAVRRLGQAQRDSGLAARLLLFEPPTSPTLWRGQGISSETLSRYRFVVQSLLDLRRHEEPLVLPLTTEARALFREAHDRLAIAGATAAGNGDEDMAAVCAKLRSAIPRMALALALAKAAEDGKAELLRSVDAAAMASAITLGEYFRQQAGVLYAKWRASEGAPFVARVQAAIRAVGEQGATRTMIRDAFGRNAKAEQIDGALAALREQGLIVKVEPPRGSIGRPAERWRVA